VRDGYISTLVKRRSMKIIYIKIGVRNNTSLLVFIFLL
jgi:hypothetical protein